MIAAFAVERVAGTHFTGVLAMANDRLNGIATLLASFLRRGDVAFLSSKNGLVLIVCEPMAAITQINIDFLRHCPRNFFDLRQNFPAAFCNLLSRFSRSMAFYHLSIPARILVVQYSKALFGAD